MPISRLEGLKGINAIARRMKGFDGLSYQQQREFLAANEAKLGAYTNNSNSLNFIKDYYDNLQFINRFGKKAFQLTGPTEEGMKFRRQKLNEGLEQERNNLINATFDSTFGNDSNIQDLRNGLDEQGKLDLLRNTNYLTDSQINDRLKQNIQKAKKDLNTYDKAHNNSSWKVDNTGGTNYDAVGTLNKWLNDTSTKLSPEKFREQDIKNNQSILDKIFSQVQKRRENSIAGLTDTIYKGILNANDKGVKSLAQSYKDFDNLATKVSNHYAQFKDSEWLSDYSNTDKLKDYAKFMALEQKYGKGIAIQYLDHSIQNRVAKAQDGVWTGNTLKKIGTTFLSDLGSQVAMMRNADAFLNPEAMGLINQGLIPIYAKDKNGNTLHDKQGNPIIIGSKKNDNIWTNPAYWNDMYMYNTTDQHEMELIKQRGGISKYVNINPYGYNPNEHMLSWGTAQEAVAQSGHIFASLAETALLGGIGKGIGLAGNAIGKGAMMAARAANASAKVLNAMSKAGRVISKTSGVANDILMNMAASMNGPQGESMGTFNEQLEKNTEAVKNQIRKELSDYAKTINYNAPHAKQQIAKYFNQLKLQDQRRLRQGAVEGVKQLPMSDATLMQQAKQMYTNSLLNEQEKYLEYKHNKDYQEAATNAARTYTKNWVADFVKENFITGGIQNYKIAKGALTGALDNTIAKNIIADAATGGVKRVVGKAGQTLAKARWQNIAKQAGKQVAGGFADEFLDGLNANMAEGIGDKSFKDYLNKNYNPEAYNATTHGAFANMVAGIDGFIGGLTDRENWYEGIIGAISPFASGAINADIITNPMNTTRALLKGIDEDGNKLNIAERLALVVNNPILSEYANAKSEDRAIEQRVKDINELIKNNKTTLNDAAKAMMALNNYSSPLQLNRYKGDDGVGSTILDSEDNKLYNVFTLMDLMHTLHGIDGGTKSQLYQDVMNNMKNIAEGKLSEDEMNDEIDKFLADKDNKSILDKPDGREIAAERLQKNAKFFMDTYKKYDEVSNTLARSSQLRNADPRLVSLLKYNLLAKDNYKERLNQIESELGVGHTDSENKDNTANLEYLYGSKASRENALKARERDLANIEDAQKANIEANNKALIDRDNAQKELDNAKDDDARKAAQDKLDEINNLMESRKFQNKSLDTQKSILKDEKAALEQLIKDDPNTILIVDGILSMDASDRAAILDERNKGNYTEFQQKIIEKAREKLKAKDPDALEKIHDAGILHDRIANSNTVYNKLLDNADLATTWLDAQEAIRDRRAAEENIERVLKDSYKKLNDAYDSDDAETLKREVLGNESTVLDAYMQDNPDKADKVKPYYEMRNFLDGAAAIIASSDENADAKEIRFRNVISMLENANSVDDITKNIENFIDNPNVADDDNKAFFNNLLDKMQALGYQRDATKVHDRAEKKRIADEEKAKREEEEKQRQEAAKKQAEEETKAKAEAEKATAEAAEIEKQKQQEEKEKQEAAKQAAEEASGKPAVNLANVDNPNTATETKEEPVDLGISFINALMDKDAEESDVDAGSMWHTTDTTPRMENMTVSLKNNKDKKTITFKTGDKEDALTVPIDNRQFEAKSIEKDGDDWYFNGNFVGETEQRKVKADKDFNLEQAIDNQKKQRQEALAPNKVSSMDLPLDNDGNAIGSSPTIEEQADEAKADDVDAQVVSEDTLDTDDTTLNAQADEDSDVNNNNPTISGNGMSEWQSGNKYNNVLDKNGILKHKEGNTPNDSMNTFYAWTKARNWYIQDVIDKELWQIAKANPNLKVKFLTVNAIDKNNDKDVCQHLFLVVDYDDTINRGITSIHKESSGSIVEAQGKKYLVIGTTYGKNGTIRGTLRDYLWSSNKSNKAVKEAKQKAFGENSAKALNGYGVLREEMVDYFHNNPNEEFFVSEKYQTEIVPDSLIPGFIVKQREDEDHIDSNRSIVDLLNDTDRNPYGIKLSNSVWAIQELSEKETNTGNLLVVRTNNKDKSKPLAPVMRPRNYLKNMGAVFFLFPASNGKYLCAHLNQIHYSEMKDSALKEQVNNLLDKLCSQDYNERKDAIKALMQIFYLSKDWDNILTSADGQITLINHNSKEPAFSDNVRANFDRAKFLDKFLNNFNPLVNVTAKALGNVESIKKLAEAGALTTDISQLATAGSSFNIYGVGVDGKIIKPTVNQQVADTQNNSYENNQSVILYTYNGSTNRYIYNKDTGTYSLNGQPLNRDTDSGLIKELEYNRMKLDGSLTYASSRANNEYYIVSSEDNPKAIIINNVNNHITELSAEESKKVIDDYNKKKADEVRKHNLDLYSGSLIGEGNIQINSLTGEWTISNNPLPAIDSNTDKGKGTYVDAVDIDDGSHTIIYNGTDDGRRILSEDEANHQQTKTDNTATPKEIGIDRIVIDINGNVKVFLTSDNNWKKTVVGDFAKELVATYFPEYFSNEEQSQNSSSKSKQGEEPTSNNLEPVTTDTSKAGTISYDGLIETSLYKNLIKQAAKTKWSDAPINKKKKLKQFLIDKGVEVDNIGNSKEDIMAWIDTFKNCR